MADPASSPPGSDRQRDWAERSEQERRGARWAALAFVTAIVAGLGLLILYVQGGHTQWEGVLLFVAFGSVGLGLGIWIRVVVGSNQVVEPRLPMTSTDEERQAFGELYAQALAETDEGGRRRFLVRLLVAAAGTLGIAIAFPLRSLGPGPKRELFHTDWREGSRLTTIDGRLLRREDIRVDQAVTVFPEGTARSADSQAFLIGTRPGAIEESALREPTVDGIVCYSKICTHAGCPVGLYRAAAGELLCPCHQSTFDVNRGAAVVSGPAGRALPQLPIGVDDDGYLVALGDFSEPVGPSFWNMTHELDGS